MRVTNGCRLGRSVGHFLSRQRRSLYHVTNESSVKDKHDLYLSWGLAAWCHRSLNAVPFHCGGQWCIADLCALCGKLLSAFDWRMISNTEEKEGWKKGRNAYKWIKQRAAEPSIVCRQISTVYVFLPSTWIWYWVIHVLSHIHRAWIVHVGMSYDWGVGASFFFTTRCITSLN